MMVLKANKDKHFEFYRNTLAKWLYKTLQFTSFRFSDSFFECLFYYYNNDIKIIKSLRNHIISYISKNNKDDINDSLYSDINENKAEIIDDILTIIKENKNIKKKVIEYIKKDLVASFDVNIEYPEIEMAIADLFNLDKDRMNVSMFAYSIVAFRCFREYFDHELHLDEYDKRYELSEMLDISLQKCKSIIVELKNFGILEEENYLALNYIIKEIWLDCDTEKLLSTFCKTLPQTNIDFEKCNIPDEVKNHVLSILQHKDDDAKQILLYGAPGTGKTTFASCLAKELGVKAWIVGCDATESSDSRRASLTACIKMATRNGDDLVIVDEAESLLDTDISERYNTASTKAWLNVFLEKQRAKIIWITNHVKHIDHAVRRRFSYSIYFPELKEKERIEIWVNTAKYLNVSEKISVSDIEKLARQYKIQVATIEKALKQAIAIAGPGEFVPCVERYLTAYSMLQNNGNFKKESEKDKNDEYNENCACVEQSFENLLSRCRKIDKLMRSKSEKLYPGMGTILFYGPPGTGKSALARHIADILNRKYILRRVSDLVTPYVGETEQNIAEAFAEAEKEYSVLVFDEVDSFLQSRESAHASWEITQTNEFLTQLEKFKGFCICTTNLRSIMDNASMRRFSFKIGFSYAKATQIEMLYKTILAPLTNEPLPRDMIKLLCKEKTLTPGDFYAVRMQFWLDDPSDVSHKDLILALQRECSMKLESNVKCIGF